MSEQAVAIPQKAFREMDDVIKMDCLNDAIYDLEELRNKLDEKFKRMVIKRREL